MNLFDAGQDDHHGKLNNALLRVQKKYGRNIIKTASELRAEKRVGEQ
jgi:hypothetical protein